MEATINTCFLAILFNKIIESGQPPSSSWSSAHIGLICKGSDTNSPSNFRSIDLSSCTGKLLNKIIATEQNKALSIIELEAENHFWRRIMDGLPSGQLSFLLRAGSETLPTPMNLQRYKIQVSSHCKLCQRPQTTTGHILSACPEALEQGRYTWRHDSVLLSLVRSLGKVNPNIQIYADIDNMRAQEHPPATIPPSLSSTSSHPDIVCVNGPNITLFELTVSGNSKEAMRQAREQKQQKRPYLEITNDLHAQTRTECQHH